MASSKSKLFILFLSIFAFQYAFADNSFDSINYSTTFPNNGRFELIQSPILAKLTIKVDLYTGRSWQLVEAKSGDLTWQKIPIVWPSCKVDCIVRGHELDSLIHIPKRINYQLYMSGIIVKITLLMNIYSGQTWILTKVPRFGLVWEPIENK